MAPLSKSFSIALFAGLSFRCVAMSGLVDEGVSADLYADDECADGVCALNELQLRASAAKARDPAETEDTSEPVDGDDEELGADGVGEGDDQINAMSSRHHRHRHEHLKWAKTEFGVPASSYDPNVRNGAHQRRRRLVLWKPTPVVDDDQQPEVCSNYTLKKGYQGCCAGQVYDFIDMGCCGSLLYRTNELSCCRHRNHTATIYNALTSNCCDDPLKKNKDEGAICHMVGNEPSCCHIETTGGRRRHNSHYHHHH